MKKLNLKLGGIKEMLSREQMKKVVGGDGYGYYDSNSKSYRCCPGAFAINIQCSECVTVPAGYTASCTMGNLTAC